MKWLLKSATLAGVLALLVTLVGTLHFLQAISSYRPLPRRLLVVAPQEAWQALFPLMIRRQEQGFWVHFLPSHKVVSHGQLSLPFSSGFVLLVGNPFLPPSSPYHLPSLRAVKQRVYTRKPLGTGFPMGEVPIARVSDAAWVFARLGDFAVGRFPADEVADVERAVAKTLRYDDIFGQRRRRSFFLFAEAGGFSPLIDRVLEGIAAGVLTLNMPRHFKLRHIYTRGSTKDHSLDVVDGLRSEPDLAVFMGHGAPDRLGSLLTLRAVQSSPLQRVGGPLFLMACTTGFQGKGDIAEALFACKGGPSHVIFASAKTHPYADGLYGFALLGQLRGGGQRPIGAFLGSGYVAARRGEPSIRPLLDRAAARLAGLTAQDRAGLREDVGMIHNLYGDPSQVIHLGRAP